MSVAEFGLGGGNSGDGRTGAVAANSAQPGLWALLATVTMLFAGFTSAYLVRRAGSDWQSILSPSVLCFNTVLLLASSMTLEIAREAMHRHQSTAFKLWHSATTLLGWPFSSARSLPGSSSPHGASTCRPVRTAHFFTCSPQCTGFTFWAECSDCCMCSNGAGKRQQDRNIRFVFAPPTGIL